MYQPVPSSDAEANKQGGYYYPQQYPPQQYQQYPPQQYQQYPPQQQQGGYVSSYNYAQPQPPPQQYQSPQEPLPPYGGGEPYKDPEGDRDSDAGIAAFSDKSVRHGFIRKVYTILFCQLLVSIAIVCLFVLHPAVNRYARKSVAMFFTAWIATIVIMIAIACCENVRRSFPLNFILLALFTLCESYLLGVVSAHYQVNEVLLAMGIVAFLSLAITLFAFQTKIDFTMMSGCLFVALIVLICFGILTIFIHGKIIRLIYACLGALIFGLYLVMDTQLMMGGGKKYSISPEDYIFAALNLYIDIIMLFMYILEIIGIARS